MAAESKKEDGKISSGHRHGDDSDQQIGRFIQISSVVTPDPKAHGRYRELFTNYRGLYESLKEKFPVLHRAIREEA